ncbi:hypothetical protein QQX10_10700 [Demequina sp. SYSU T00039]|uniref:Apea-like HEPN domain-containing protein n=1 Tax=Demequina lignilytica TaxID=3051663 RepID=A0AAW7M9T6_9MICO|nr:hypothetical protein [Demequina sp. SYSU T00039]MDN4488636.1 hypothetical protein [Demequina sp. SYSU T00039]
MRDVAQAATRGQHTLVLLPETMLADANLRADLRERIAELVRARALSVFDPDASDLVAALSDAVYLGDDVATLPELLTHDEVAGRAFVLDASELDSRHRKQLADLLRRLDAESRAVSVENRATFVVLAGLDDGLARAGDASGGVALRTVWFWNRVARWDVAAWLKLHDPARDFSSLASEIRLETVIEAARWNLSRALALWKGWDGSPGHLLGLVAVGEEGPSGDLPSFASDHRIKPPAGCAEDWNRGMVEFWHGAMTLLPAGPGLVRSDVDRLIWQAQVRVLLPWIELQRIRLVQATRERLGAERFAEQVRLYDASSNSLEDGGDVVEIGPLAFILVRTLGKTAPQFTDTAHVLRKARNKLAHLDPLGTPEISRLVEVTAWLR